MTKAALLIAALASLAAPDTADACGGYAPRLQVFRLAKHGGRTFMLQGRDNRTGISFTALSPYSYDSTAVAMLPKLERPVALTVANDRGTAKMATTTQVLLANDYMDAGGKQARALELPRSKEVFDIAVAGEHTSIAWKPVVETSTVTDADRTWLAENRQYADFKDAFTKYEMPGTGYVAFVQYVADGEQGHYLSLLRNSDGLYAGVRYGHPFGVAVVDGETWGVFDTDGIESTLQLY